MSIFDDIRKDAEAGTPGPWRKRQSSNHIVALDWDIAVSDNWNISESQNSANARRIARVPHLEAIALAAEELRRVASLVWLDISDSELADELVLAIEAVRKASE